MSQGCVFIVQIYQSIHLEEFLRTFRTLFSSLLMSNGAKEDAMVIFLTLVARVGASASAVLQQIISDMGYFADICL